MFTGNQSRVFLTMSFSLLAAVSVVNAQYSGGSGTADDPYQIATAADLISLSETPDDYDKHFILTADIDLAPNLPGRKAFNAAVIALDTDAAYTSHQGTDFTCVFDGDGHRVSHMTIEGETCLGFFGETGSGASISNLGLEAADVGGIGRRVVGLVGFKSARVLSVCFGMTPLDLRLSGGRPAPGSPSFGWTAQASFSSQNRRSPWQKYVFPLIGDVGRPAL